MKKILLFAVAVVMLSACGGRKAPQDGGHGIGINSATIAQNNSDDDYVPQRSDYSFRTEVRTVKEDDEVHWDTISSISPTPRDIRRNFSVIWQKTEMNEEKC